MNLGVIGRADSRGLAIQTEEVARHMRPAKVLLIDLGPERSPYKFRWERWGGLAPDVEVLELHKDEGPMSHEVMARFLDGLDAVYAAETPYNFDLFTEARRLGVHTTLHVNYEFNRYLREPNLPRPDTFAVPTTWHIDAMLGAVHLPMPVDRGRLVGQHRDHVGRFLHTAGHKASHDRNGTRVVNDALPYLMAGTRLKLRSQSRQAMRSGPVRNAQLEVEAGDHIEDYWRLYEGTDVLVLPRRYGGMSLPMQEALALCMPVLMSDAEPQRSMLPPEALVPAKANRTITVGCVTIDRYDVNPRDLAAKMNELTREPELVAMLSKAADEWAGRHSWEALMPWWQDVLSGGC